MVDFFELDLDATLETKFMNDLGEIWPVRRFDFPQHFSSVLHQLIESSSMDILATQARKIIELFGLDHFIAIEICNFIFK